MVILVVASTLYLNMIRPSCWLLNNYYMFNLPINCEKIKCALHTKVHKLTPFAHQNGVNLHTLFFRVWAD